MRICIIGLARSGKSTVFQALTGTPAGLAGGNGEPVVRAAMVPDPRLDTLSKLYQPKKTTAASVEYWDVSGQAGANAERDELGKKFLAAVRPAALLVHVIDGFSTDGDAAAAAAEAIGTLDTEMILGDLDVCEKRLERMKKEGAISGPRAMEHDLLEQIRDLLTTGAVLRDRLELTQPEMMRGYSFLSAKPVITVVNVVEGARPWSPEQLPAAVRQAREGSHGAIIPICAKVEAEIAALAHDDAVAFLADYGIAEPARERVIRLSYELLGLMSFFTVGEDEVRAWTIRRDAAAQEAAGVIHSDIARGFIRAEVVDYETVMALGGFEAAKKRGKVRQEGRAYAVRDGDVMSFKFNV